VKNDELTRAKDANFINSLQGKSAGLIITPNAGGAGSASKILLRGNNSILGENTPLIVIDGIPMQNKVQGQFDSSGGGGYNMAYSARSEGSDALSGVNPEDIESMTILKGANAAALYGYAAGNGVLIITTKKGESGKIRIDVSSSTTFETPLVLPDLQNRFGATVKSDGTLTASSWGKALNELTPNELAIDGVSNKAYNVADFFNTPEIHRIDLSDYTGQPGDTIRIEVSDDTLIKEVTVSITNADGSLVEEGAAQPDTSKYLWTYTAAQVNDNLDGDKITVTVQDLPENISQKEQTL
jgi:TonB-dependent SusC/RagA subfamily outer membrane receptor